MGSLLRTKEEVSCEASVGGIMTTLIFDSSTQTVYTDSRVTTEGAEVPNTYEKGVKACYKPYGEYIVTGAGSVSLIQRAMFGGTNLLPSYRSNELDTRLYYVYKQGSNGLLIHRYKPTPRFFWDSLKFMFGLPVNSYEKTEISLKNGDIFCAGSGFNFAYAAHEALKDKFEHKQALIQEVYRIVESLDPYTDTDVKAYNFSENEEEKEECEWNEEQSDE